MTPFMTDHLIPLSFQVEVVYPPREFQQAALLQLFSDMCGPFGFQSLKLLTDNRGVIFSAEKENRCEILRDKIVIREEVNVTSFESFCASTLEMMNLIVQRINPPVFISQQNLVRMLYPLDSTQAANQFLVQSFLRLPEGLGQKLGRPLAGVGLRLVFPPTPNSPDEFQLRIEPYFRDQTQIFLELAGRFFPPFKNLDEVRSRLRVTYDFLKSSMETLL